MAVVNLTEGAITSMCSDNFTSELSLPVLQVIDLKLVQVQENRSLRRYRVVLSDGFLYQQGMLATHKNDLVDSGKLQIGSIVMLTQFACKYVADRMIIIIIDLDILMDKYDLIGVPRPAPRNGANAEQVNFASEPRVLLELTDKLRPVKVEGGTPNSVTNNRNQAIAMAVNLTEGAIMNMCTDGFDYDKLQPVLQIIDLKLVQTQQNNATKRYRVVLSDGFLYQQGMLVTHKNDLVDSGKLQIGSIVKLTQFACNHVADRMVIIIVDLDILMDKCDLIGVPKLAAPRNTAPTQPFNNSANAGVASI